MSHTIRVDGVSKKFDLQLDRARSIKELFTRRNRDATRDTFWALKDVSLEIEQGSMFGLIGHNGSGKSTLLRCIAGIYQPNSGSVSVDGRISTLLELGAGFHPDLSGRENVYLNATILGMPRKEIDRRFDDIVAFAGVEHFIDSPVKVYSTGMYVRLGFSVAVHVDPEILIIDEVIAVGDEAFQRQCFDHLYGLRKQGVTIVVVTHGMATVQTMCDRAAWLDHGVLKAVGPAPAVALQYLHHVNSLEMEAREEESLELQLPVPSGASDDEVTTSGPTRSSITHEGDHWGTGEVTITSVDFIDGSGRSTDVIESGSPLVIRIGFDCSSSVEDPTIGVAIHHEGGIHVTGTNTRLAGVRLGKVSGSGVVEYVTGGLPLLDGAFSVSVAIEDEHSQRTFDRYDHGWQLKVRNAGEQTIVGLVDIGGGWRIAT